MSESSEKSIAELIGWRDKRPEPDYAPHWHRPTCVTYGHPDNCVSCSGGPTVDDLLVWLHDNCGVLWEYGGNPGSYWFDTGQLVGEYFDTLLDALNTCVREVANND